MVVTAWAIGDVELFFEPPFLFISELEDALLEEEEEEESPFPEEILHLRSFRDALLQPIYALAEFIDEVFAIAHQLLLQELDTEAEDQP
ncbi:hypothetical protein RRF57_012852 [Xylaria bambusicola]|uniref:Uncharacterized protein n=1 Tax=Xylaria bambusicola TaxID=326684 RepID=A0AAN7UQH0_9PEZI